MDERSDPRPDDDFKSDTHRSNVGPPAAPSLNGSAPTQTTTAAAPKADPSPGASADDRETDSDRRPSLFERIFHVGRGRGTDTDDETDSDGGEGERNAEPNAGKAPEQEWKPPASKEEYERAVQAETDRRAARRTTQATQQRVTELVATRDQAVEEGDTDLAREAKGEIDRITAQQQRQEALGSLLSSTVTSYDAATLDVLRDALPDGERAQLLAALAERDPIEGRKHFTEQALKSLEKRWKAEGAAAERTRLSRNPAERKRVVLDTRDDDDEPDTDTLVGAGVSAASPDMNTLLRESYHRARIGSTNPLRITADD